MSNVNFPQVRYYARLINTTPKGKKTPKFTIIEAIGYYPPMENLKGRDGKISFNLMEKLKEGINVPSMRLQGKNSLNFIGLKDYFIGGKLSGVAYGYPSDKATYSNKNLPNPFYRYKNDGFLFVMKADAENPNNVVPTEIELIVLTDARLLISAYCSQMAMGGYDEEIRILRKSAYDNP